VSVCTTRVHNQYKISRLTVRYNGQICWRSHQVFQCRRWTVKN